MLLWLLLRLPPFPLTVLKCFRCHSCCCRSSELPFPMVDCCLWYSLLLRSLLNLGLPSLAFVCRHLPSFAIVCHRLPPFAVSMPSPLLCCLLRNLRCYVSKLAGFPALRISFSPVDCNLSLQLSSSMATGSITLFYSLHVRYRYLVPGTVPGTTYW